MSSDSGEKAKALAEKLGLTFPILGDPERKIIQSFGVEDSANEIAWPAIFIIGADGRILWRDLTDDYRERPTNERVLDALGDVGELSHGA